MAWLPCEPRIPVIADPLSITGLSIPGGPDNFREMFKQREVQVFRGRGPQLKAKGKQSNRERPVGLHAEEMCREQATGISFYLLVVQIVAAQSWSA